MTDDAPAFDRTLLRRLDWAQPSEGPPEPVLSFSPPDSHPAASARVDISAILDAVNTTATSMNAMAERIQQLEAHAEAFEASNEELEAHNQQLTINLGEAVRERDALAAIVEAEIVRLKQLENETAQHVARSTNLEHELGAAHTDLATIVNAVGNRLTITVSARFEDQLAG